MLKEELDRYAVSCLLYDLALSAEEEGESAIARVVARTYNRWVQRWHLGQETFDLDKPLKEQG